MLAVGVVAHRVYDSLQAIQEILQLASQLSVNVRPFDYLPITDNFVNELLTSQITNVPEQQTISATYFRRIRFFTINQTPKFAGY